MAALHDLIDEATDGQDADATQRIAQFAAGRGDSVMIRLETEQPTLLLTAWPEFPGARRLGTAGLRARLGEAEGAQLEHAGGYPTFRVLHPSPGPRGATYWISHPDSGRDLVIDVTLYKEGTEHDLRPYDLVATHVTWTESENDD